MTFTSDTPTCSGSWPAVMPEGIRLFFDKEFLSPVILVHL